MYEVAWMWLVAAFVCFIGVSIWGAVCSAGFLEADGCTHYMYARFAVDRHYLLIDVWGRPLVTAINALPAHFFGRLGVRFTSLAMALVCAIATYRIAVNQKYRLPVAAVIFLFAQPLFFLHSFAELTELPFAMVIVLAFWAYQRREFFVMTVLVAISPVGRPEGFGFVLLAAFALICHRRWWWLLILPVPLMIWSWAGYINARPVGPNGIAIEMHWWQWLIKNWPYEAQSNYGRGPIWWYVAQLPDIVGCLLVPAALIGGVWCWRNGKLFSPSPGIPREGRGGGGQPVDQSPHPNPPPEYRERGQEDHRRRCDFVLAALPYGILLVHSVFWFFGKFSGGELRYLLVVGPFWALTVARGWEWLTRRASAKWSLIAAAVLACLPLSVNWAYTVIPVRYSGDELVARQITDWYHGDAEVQKRYPLVMSPQPTFFYMMDKCPAGDEGVAAWSRVQVEHAPAGVMMVYEKILATFNSDKKLVIDPDTSLPMGGWVKFREFDIAPGDTWIIYLSPKDAMGRPTSIDGLTPP